MALVIQAEDPTLWASINEAYQMNTKAKWVIYGGVTYNVVQMADGSTAFNSNTNQDLYDSRSFRKSKSASYKKLDG